MKRTLALLAVLVTLTLPSRAAAAVTTVAGAWYTDARDGQRVSLIPGSHLDTTRGRVELPQGQNLLYLRCARACAKFGGVGHRDDLAWEWSWLEHAWSVHGTAFGPLSVIYDANDEIRVRAGWPAIGYRYVREDGAIISAEATYADQDRRLWEYTDFADAVSIGQGGAGIYGEDPLVALVDGVRHLIAPGQNRFVHAYRDGDRFTVSAVQEDQGGAIVAELTRAELSALPIATDTDTPDPIIPPPPPPPPPPAAGMPDRQAVLVALRREYGALLDQQQAGELMARLAWALRGEGFGLYRKDGGNSCPVPNSAVRVSCDIILHRPTSTWCDVLGNGPDVGESGPSTPAWCDGSPGDMTNFFAPPDPGGGTVTPPPPPPPPPPAGVTRAEMDAAITVAVATLRAEMQAKFDALPAPAPNGVPEDRVNKMIADAFAAAVITGRTGRDRLGLDHPVGTLKIEWRKP